MGAPDLCIPERAGADARAARVTGSDETRNCVELDGELLLLTTAEVAPEHHAVLCHGTPHLWDSHSAPRLLWRFMG
jgi:hypothetical protein